MPGAIDSFLARFSKVKKSSKGWQACCPAHDDRQASLSIAVKDQKILLHCHAGCESAAILAAIGLKMKDLFLTPRPVKNGKSQIVATYDYIDKAGRLLFQAVRFEPKNFRQRRPDPTGRDGWTWNLKGVDLVPYRLPDILKAPTVFIVEGEKDAESLWSIGLAATCNPMGAGKWRPEFSKYLEGKEVFILPDLDDPGRKHAQDVAAKLHGHALKIKIVELPATPGVKDVSDWLANGGTKKALLELISQAGPWQPPDAAPVRTGLKTITAAELKRKQFPAIKWAMPGLLPEGLTILAGRPKRGKSWMGLGIALAVASGGFALGKLKVEPGEALYLALEDNERRLQNRLAVLQSQDPEISPRLHLVTDFPPLQMGGMQDLLDWLDTHPAIRLVVIDTLGRILPSGKRNNNQFTDDYQFIGKLQKFAIDRAFALLIIHHIRKESADYALDRVAGTTGITGAADSVWVLDTGKGDASAILHATGRDIEEQELALNFEHGLWTLLGKAEEVTISDERREIISLLQENGPMFPKTIGDALGKNPNTTRVLLFTMKKGNLITLMSDGRYSSSTTP